MAGMKKLCKWDKARIRKKAEKLKEELREPQYYCKKCARAARSAERLCKPQALGDPERPV